MFDKQANAARIAYNALLAGGTIGAGGFEHNSTPQQLSTLLGTVGGAGRVMQDVNDLRVNHALLNFPETLLHAFDSFTTGKKMPTKPFPQILKEMLTNPRLAGNRKKILASLGLAALPLAANVGTGLGERLFKKKADDFLRRYVPPKIDDNDLFKLMSGEFVKDTGKPLYYTKAPRSNETLAKYKQFLKQFTNNFPANELEMPEALAAITPKLQNKGTLKYLTKGHRLSPIGALGVLAANEGSAAEGIAAGAGTAAGLTSLGFQLNSLRGIRDLANKKVWLTRTKPLYNRINTDLDLPILGHIQNQIKKEIEPVSAFGYKWVARPKALKKPPEAFKVWQELELSERFAKQKTSIKQLLKIPAIRNRLLAALGMTALPGLALAGKRLTNTNSILDGLKKK